MTFGRRPVQGIGINDVYDDPFIGKTPQAKYYKVWLSIYFRCYSPRCHQKLPTYMNCSVSKEWIYLSNFREWFNQNYVEGYHLDKDLLFPGNKVYGPNTCVFVTSNINSLFVFSNSTRGKYPLGVNFHKTSNLFEAKCKDGKGNRIRKTFKDPTEGHFFYLEQKINIINQYLEEDHSEQIKTGLNRWKQLLTYHVNNKIIFDPDNINMTLYNQ